ncbi:Golgin subfamily A member 7/ERF4 family-domain-containing protein [Xylariaceae sp. FL0255]|nr:Golgin subfamily A member 7/ERF4 family-domain-containing protein [Xylariaceae sp. FL0255]
MPATAPSCMIPANLSTPSPLIVPNDDANFFRRGGSHLSNIPPTASHGTSRPANTPSATLDLLPHQFDLPIDSFLYDTNSNPNPTPRRPKQTPGRPIPPIQPQPLPRLPPPVFRKPENRFPPRLIRPGRLWNPTNSTPRPPPISCTRPSIPRRRRSSTPPPPSLPINHPTFEITASPDDPDPSGTGNYPLLTLSEQQQTRQRGSARSSLRIEGRLSEDKRVSLPSSVRQSYDRKRNSFLSVDENLNLPHNVSFPSPSRRVDQGKGKAVMSTQEPEAPSRGFSKDLERGPDAIGQHPNLSNLSLPGGIGSAISSSNSSIIGDPDQHGLGEEWGPQHPCFPHLNPHVPIDSKEYKTTRIIRVRRDWLIAGDLAPTFSNIYPEILDPAGVTEQEFRRIIEKLNGTLLDIFNPFSWRNIFDGVLGALSGWVWDDIGLTNAKTRLNALEKWIEKWNADMEKTMGSEEGVIAPKIISLRRTGYMNLDFQIPDPEVSLQSEPASRSGPAVPEPAMLNGAPDAS